MLRAAAMNAARALPTCVPVAFVAPDRVPFASAAARFDSATFNAADAIPSNAAALLRPFSVVISRVLPLAFTEADAASMAAS